MNEDWELVLTLRRESNLGAVRSQMPLDASDLEIGLDSVPIERDKSGTSVNSGYCQEQKGRKYGQSVGLKIVCHSGEPCLSKNGRLCSYGKTE